MLGRRNSGFVWAVSALIAVALVTAWAENAAANCGAPTALEAVDQSQALDVAWHYNANDDTYSITLTNNRPAWYYVLESHPAAGDLCWPFGATGQAHSLGTNKLPEAIAPNGRLEISGVRVLPGDHFGICHIGLLDAPPGYEVESRWIKAVVALDVVGLAFLGEKLGTTYAEGGVLALVRETVDAADMGLLPDVVYLLEVLGRPNVSKTEIAAALLTVLTPNLAVKSQMIDVYRQAFHGDEPPSAFEKFKKMVSDLFELNDTYSLLRRLHKFVPYWTKTSIAYGVAPWGRIGIRTVVASPSGNHLPEGFVLQPAENEVVGNTLAVHGVASDDCNTIQFVNVTYSTDNGQTWTFAGQDTSSPYDISVNLASVPDGTSVLLGWDVYDSSGAHANSPSGHRRVVKNAAALAPLPYDADYESDVEPYTDGAIVAPGQVFTKGWRVRNSGTATWSSAYSLVFVSGTNLATVTSVPLPALAPGQVGTVNVPMIAPSVPRLYRSTWRFKNPAGVEFGSSVFALIEVRAEAPGSGTCDPSDRCLNMGCSTHSAPPDGMRFKTPATGSGVFYARGGYKHSYPTSACYHLFYDDFTNLSCVANANAAPPTLADGPQACTEGSFYREDGHAAIYRMESGRLRPLCGNWTSASFRGRWGFPFQIAFLVDSAHFDNLTSAYPILSGNGIYPTEAERPVCGQPGLQCGDHVDPEGVCYGTLHCGGCGAGAQCLAGTCVAEPLAVGPGAITSPADGATIASGAVTVGWSHGVSSDGSPVKSAVFCSVDGGPWEVRVGFVAETSAVIAFAPGVDVQCKLRTRLETAWDEWTESPPVTWSVSGATAAMTVVAITERPDSNPNGCDALQIDARIRNDGGLPGTWEARAYLHPILEDEHSPQAVEALQPRWVTLAPGAEATYTFTLATTAPLPLAAAGWAVTVVVPDPQAFGPTGRATVDAIGHDAGAPQFDAFQIYGFAGSPVELVPGRTHTIQVAAHDDYALDTWELAWRSDGGWNPITEGAAYTNGCRELFGSWHGWTVPVGLPAGTLLEIRARFRDLAGNLTEQIRPARLRSSAVPSLTFIRPMTGEQHVGSSAAAPRCVPFEAIVVPGVPLQSIAVGFTNAAHVAREQHTAVPVPVDGRVAGCLPAYQIGDAIELYLQLRDTNGSEFMFFAGPIRVAFASPEPPWGPVVLEPNQGPPPPSPVPATQGGQAWTEYIGLKADATTVTVHRLDRAHWTDEGTGMPQDRHALRRLTFALADLAPLSSTTIVNSFTEVDAAPAGGAYSFAVSAYDGWPFFYDVVALGGCVPSSSTPCDYETRVREVVAGGPGPWRTLATYPGLLSYETPILFNEVSSLVPSTGARFLSVLDIKLSRTTLSRSTGSGWSTVNTFDPSMRVAGAQGGLWGFRRMIDGSGNTWISATPVDPVTGATGAPVNLASGTSLGYTWTLARDEAQDRLVVIALDVGGNRVRVARLQGGTWIESAPQAIAATWHGHALANRNLNGALASGGRVRALLNVSWSGGSANLALVFSPGDPIDLERGFEEDGLGTVALAPDGRMVKTFVCRWNFEERMCLQLGHAVTAACWDGNPCTDDVWDPIAGACGALSRTCASDGDACNGPEVCDPATGLCGTNAAAAPTCGDGLWCNGSEACVAATGACAAGPAPVVDDGRSCTNDSCDEAADVVRHEPDDTRCVAGHCEVAVCAPSAAGADAAGCVRTPVAIVPDTLTCTDDACDPDTGDTIHPIRAGFCLIDGICYPSGALDPGGCRTCAPAVRATEWTPATDGAACNDGLYCTVGEVCASGSCVGGARNCGMAPLPCLALACDEIDDECQLIVRADGDSCDDGDPCNGVATCNAGACIPGTPLAVDDGLVCTDDVCDPFLGEQHPTNSAACNADSNGCTADDQCAGGGCAVGTLVDCSNVDDQCNVGRCASTGPNSHACLRDPAPREGLGCDDDDLCSTGDHCAAGACVAASQVECPPVTDECHERGTCDPGTGLCSEPLPLDDTPCTGGRCVDGTCVPEVDAGPVDAAPDATDADDDAAPPDAVAPDAGDEPPAEGCECNGGTPGAPSAIVLCIVFLAVLRRRRARPARNRPVAPRSSGPGQASSTTGGRGPGEAP